MAEKHDQSHSHDGGCDHCGCCASVDRRDFMTAVSLSAVAAQGMLAGLASSAVAASGEAPAKTRGKICVAFVRPNVKEYWMGWPGKSYDIAARQAQYTKIIKDAAAKEGIDVEVTAEPLETKEQISAYAAHCDQVKPTGVILCSQSLNHSWPPMQQFCDERPQDLPTIVFSPMGTSFTGHLAYTRDKTKVLTAATQQLDWLAQGVRMLRTIHDMGQSRLLIMRTERNEEEKLAVIGTTLVHRPLDGWLEMEKQVEEGPEVKQLAAELQRTSKKSVEPNEQDVLNAAKNYFIAKRLMAEHGCDGISLNCLGLVGSRKIACPPCMAWGLLNNELSVGCCECDWNAAISLRLVSYLVGRPGFMQDPCPNTVNGTLMGAHCSSPWKLRGGDADAEPLILRSHSESDVGVSPQVIWPIGERVTLMKFNMPQAMWIGTGEVVSNIDTPPAGGCRTSVEVTVDGKADPRDVAGFHQLFLLGDHAKTLQDYCELAGIAASPI